MRGGTKYNTGSLKQGVWGAVPPEAIGFLFFKYKTYQMQNSHTVLSMIRFVGGAIQYQT